MNSLYIYTGSRIYTQNILSAFVDDANARALYKKKYRERARAAHSHRMQQCTKWQCFFFSKRKIIIKIKKKKTTTTNIYGVKMCYVCGAAAHMREYIIFYSCTHNDDVCFVYIYKALVYVRGCGLPAAAAATECTKHHMAIISHGTKRNIATIRVERIYFFVFKLIFRNK